MTAPQAPQPEEPQAEPPRCPFCGDTLRTNTYDTRTRGESSFYCLGCDHIYRYAPLIKGSSVRILLGEKRSSVEKGEAEPPSQQTDTRSRQFALMQYIRFGYDLDRRESGLTFTAQLVSGHTTELFVPLSRLALELREHEITDVTALEGQVCIVAVDEAEKLASFMHLTRPLGRGAHR